MKKTVLLTLVLCLTLGLMFGFIFCRDGLNEALATAESAGAAEPAESAETAGEETAGEEEAAEGAGRLDYEALYALYEPEEIVMTIGEREITWGEYFYYLYRYATNVEQFFDNYAMYGMNLAWGDTLEEDGTETYADYVIETAESTALSISAMGAFADSIGTVLSEENRAAIAEKEQADYTAACGENATREDFEAFLKTIYMPTAVYDYMNEVSVLFQQGFLELYGETGEKLSDEETLAWMEKSGYMSSNHILFMTIDMTTGEALDEETKAEKLAQAQAVADELKAIGDRDALLARFAELKQELDEDTGKTAYPDGYVFTPGMMVSEFEETTAAQQPYEVSDPVETAYGYHVIMTLPLDPDAVIQYSDNGAPMTARALAASETYTTLVDAYALEQELVWREGYAAPDLTAFVK